MSLLAPILWNLLTHPQRIAVSDDQGPHTSLKLFGGAFHLAHFIGKATGKPNVGLMLPTGVTFPMALLGAWQAGKTVVPINYLLEKKALHHVIADSGIDTLLTVGKLLEHIGGEGMVPPGVRVVKLDELKFAGCPPVRPFKRPKPQDLAVILYTSGTSGLPKGVMLTHGNLESNARGAAEHAQLKTARTFLGVLPNFHAFGITVLTLVPLLLGARAVYTARFVPRRLVELMEKEQADVFIAVPSMFAALLGAKNASVEAGQSLRFVVSGAEPLPEAVTLEFKRLFGKDILEGYGLTETSPASHWSTPWAHKPRSVGKPLPGVRTFIVDDKKSILGPGADGEIWLAGPNLMAGYWNRPDLTEEAIAYLEVPGEKEPVRCLRTGDIGRVDAENFLYITGRKKEMLIVAGENVFPREIEEVLNHHPAVGASAVVGKKDGLRGEVPVAFVEFKEGQSAPETELRAHCAKELPAFKVPKEIRVVEQLPRNPTGKILRRELMERVLGE